MGYESSKLEGRVHMHGPYRGKLGHRNRLAGSMAVEEGNDPTAECRT